METREAVELLQQSSVGCDAAAGKELGNGVSGNAAVQRSCAEPGEGMQGVVCSDAVQSKEEGKLCCRS